jgi:signal transduction histidine kinase/DNA-binding NarL/FixJ family response regulator
MGSSSNKEMLFEETALTGKSFSILLVEDNAGDVVIIRELLRSSGIDFSLVKAGTLRETLLLCVEQEFDIMLLDLGLPDSIGLETLKKIQVFNMKIPVVVMTGLDDEDIALKSLREGAQDYLVKNRLTPDNILRSIKYGIERKKIQDLLKRNASQFSLLSSTTTAINECEEVSAIYGVVCSNICALLTNAGTVAVELNNSANIYTSGIEIFEPWYDKIKLITGINLYDPELNGENRKKELSALFSSAKFCSVTDGTKKLPDPGINKNDYEKSSATPELLIYAIGFKRGEMTYGGALIFVHYSIGDDDINIIETISNQVSLSLQRKAIEKDLISSESRYRKLSKDLEKKVRERTRDLEASNYQLNQQLVELHLAEEALRKSEARLKELNATKDKFFNIIAHDLKNPFTCLLGSTELLSQRIHNMETDQTMELVQIISDSAKSGYAILQNLLDWSRSQTGLITYNPEKIDLKHLINENISNLKESSAVKEISISSRVKDMSIFTDKNMINTVLRNLISNAIKFTPKFGTITIIAGINNKEAVINVKDTGIGIPEENIKDLFRIDTKYSRPGTNKEQGTGLGLKLCKEFVELLGGTIRVESTVNKGSEFIFSIPVNRSGS